MRGLLFRMGTGLYALRLAHIREVLPMVQWRQVPGTEPSVLGLLNLRGQSVPVIDVARHCLGQSEPVHLRTRIVVLPCDPTFAACKALGVVLQTTGDIVELPEPSAQACPLNSKALPFLAGLIQRDGQESVQWIDAVRLTTALAPLLRSAGAVHV